MYRVAIVACLLAVGCSPTFHRDRLEGALRSRAPLFDDAAIEAIERLRPQARLPIDIVVSQPLAGRAWTPDEIAEMESWEQPLRRAGFARRLTVLPESLLDCRAATCDVDAQRRAAARLGADALLVMNPATDVDEYFNVLVPLDITIVGLWFVPAHHRDALTLLEGTLIDNRNQYIYAVARGDGEARAMRPFAFAAQTDAPARSRLAALKALGQRLLTDAVDQPAS